MSGPNFVAFFSTFYDALQITLWVAIALIALVMAAIVIFALIVIFSLPRKEAQPSSDDKVLDLEPNIRDFEQLLLRDEVRRGLAAGETAQAIARRLLIPVGKVLTIIDEL